MPAKLTSDELAFIKKHGGAARCFAHDGYPIDLIERRTWERSDSPALVHRTKVLSYGQLNAKANELAGQAREAGVGKGDFVPLIVGGDFNLVISMLALMKLGAAFVIMDRDWPPERKHELLADLGAPLALVDRDDPELTDSVRTIEVDHACLPGADHVWFPREILGEEPLYGFFTSGSTGKPKCCVNTQRGLRNRFGNMSAHFALARSEAVLMNSSHVFDSALWQLLWPLTVGARVVLPSAEQRRDLRKTIDLIGAHSVAMTDFVPSTFRLLVRLLESEPGFVGRLESLRFVLIGGEKINPECVRGYQRLLPATRLVNTYGPTEASIGMMFHHIPERCDDIPLGTPIANTYAVILDPAGNPCAPGAVGEIAIGGACLGAGYLNRPLEETEAYLRNPCPWIPGGYLYRTGDLGYLRADGAFQYVSRINDTLKVNGVLVCLPEVEAHIKATAGVDDACVVVRSAQHGARLHAFVIPAAGVDPSGLDAAIGAGLERSLPKSSQPQAITFVDKFPLLDNGKVDRRRLQRISRAEPAAPGAPGGAIAGLRRIFAQLLDGAAPAVDGNLFDAGLDSLSAQFARLEIRKAFDCELDLSALYERPTIRQLARHLAGHPDDQRQLVDEYIKRDLRLADELDFRAAAAPARASDDILLTGATGFIGSYLLTSLLARSKRRIVALVRAEDDSSARARLRESARRFSLEREIDFSRVDVVAADIAEHNFGLTPERIAEVLGRVSEIVLNATQVNFLLCYQSLRKTNTLPVYHTLELVQQFGPRNIYYVSSLAVLNRHRSHRHLDEDHDVRCPEGGYAQSKWVAENLLLAARERGLSVAIIRLGEIMPSTRHGIPNKRAFFSALIDTCMALGLAPFSRARICYTPVDYIAGYCSKLILSDDPDKFCNIHGYRDHALSFYEVILNLARLSGCPMSFVDIDTFKERLAQAPEAIKPQVDQLTAITHRLDAADPLNDYFEDYTRCYQQSNFRKWSRPAVTRPDHDDALFEAYSRYLLPIAAARVGHAGAQRAAS